MGVRCDMDRPQRYVRVSWDLIRQTDLEPQGEPETLVETSRMRIFGLVIKAGDALLPNGASHAMLSIRAIDSGEPGGRITMALTSSLPVCVVPDYPQRYDDDGDGA